MKQKRVVRIAWSILLVIFVFLSVAIVANGKDDKTNAVSGWRPISARDAPSPRINYTAIWTGKEMIIWGGQIPLSIHPPIYDFINTGGRYNLSTDTWREISTTNAPLRRAFHTAVWTGKEMIVWGGVTEKKGDEKLGLELPNTKEDDNAIPTYTGGRYDPLTDTWTEISTKNAPSASGGAIWTGKEMIIWDGRNRTGGMYDPSNDTWKPIATKDAPLPRYNPTVIWTGKEMIIWGGQSREKGELNIGGRYDPSTDKWKATSSTNAPLTSLIPPTVFWVGKEMIVWDLFYYSCNRYNPLTDKWTPCSTKEGPTEGSLKGIFWTGKEMIVCITEDRYKEGRLINIWGRYNPTTDTWTTISIPQALPKNKIDWIENPIWTISTGEAIWAGKEIIIWGGWDYHGVYLNTGWRYSP